MSTVPTGKAKKAERERKGIQLTPSAANTTKKRRRNNSKSNAEQVLEARRRGG
jgi:hypothetical protein